MAVAALATARSGGPVRARAFSGPAHDPAGGGEEEARLAGRRVGEAAGRDVAGPGPARRLARRLRLGVKCSAVPRHTAAAEALAAANYDAQTE